jgi:hypothetical protein
MLRVTQTLARNGCFSGSTFLALSKYAVVSGKQKIKTINFCYKMNVPLKEISVWCYGDLACRSRCYQKGKMKIVHKAVSVFIHRRIFLSRFIQGVTSSIWQEEEIKKNKKTTDVLENGMLRLHWNQYHHMHLSPRETDENLVDGVDYSVLSPAQLFVWCSYFSYLPNERRTNAWRMWQLKITGSSLHRILCFSSAVIFIMLYITTQR